jgi:mannose-6-phosphate isomerase-like protein (cupin superfamily)
MERRQERHDDETEGKVLNLRSVFGLEATVTTPSAATDGAYVELDVMLEPEGETNVHIHPDQEETYEVLAGTLEVLRDGHWQRVPAGDSLTVPRGAAHAFRSASETPVRFLNVHRPALTFQGYLETLDRLIRAGKIKGLPRPPRLKNLRSGIYISMAFIEEARSVSVTPPHKLIRGLAFIGRRLGYTLE